MTNPKTLLECLRILAKHSDKIYPSGRFEYNGWEYGITDETEPEADEFLYLEKVLIQIAKEKKISASLMYNIQTHVKTFDQGVVSGKTFLVGKDGIENMAHALAVVLVEALEEK